MMAGIPRREPAARPWGRKVLGSRGRHPGRFLSARTTRGLALPLVEYRQRQDGWPRSSYAYLRKTDGAPAVRLGEGRPFGLSPDGKWVLSTLFTPPQILLLPTGAGEAKRLERGAIEQYAAAVPEYQNPMRARQ